VPAAARALQTAGLNLLGSRARCDALVPAAWRGEAVLPEAEAHPTRALAGPC
jgi:hypothetical protein